MGYPEKLLAEDETVVEHLHPHWITLVPATAWFLVICVFVGIGLGNLPDGATHNAVMIIIIVVALGLFGYLVLRPLITWRSSHYVFTTHRVLIRRGIARHTGRDISLQRISDVSFTQSLLDRIVRAGSVTIESAGEHGQETLHNLPNSSQQQQLLNQLIERDSDRRNGRINPQA
ncbi:PH (Pleckstrin Homology) domain-containing protein [Jatrophihabitans sp. GAS493]|uniref:PH domain-containing protein n=1 Tax=Jatrophihabitans sp. GAS493 TaxID=1907575 RepID=UPI000BB90496|nr:PH domain-containing protein [Jatrophihabitans sp. GAS493]SOD74780.1 PH (Pleckstrin Homology) domain-containing protein [Jatrophihabitans sp. GAS493]